MKQEHDRLLSWKENLIEAAKDLFDEKPFECAFKIGFTVQGIMIAIAELENEGEE